MSLTVRRCVLDCCVGRENWSWFRSPDVHQPHTQICTHRDYWHERMSLKHGFRRNAAAVLLPHADFVAARLSGCLNKISPPLFMIVLCAYDNTPLTHTRYIQKRTHIHPTKMHNLWLSQRRELIARLLLYRDCHNHRAWMAMCDAVHSSRAKNNINIWVSVGPVQFFETRQAAVWALLCGSCPARLRPRSTTTRETAAARCQSPT